MAKEPVGGRIKTRLARQTGVSAALRFQRTNLALTLLRLRADPRWQTILAVAPETAVTSRLFPARVPRMAQPRGDLGERMAAPLANLPPGPVVIIGADIPAVAARDIARAFKALKSASVVFGPARDGGYWLIGAANRTRRLRMFDNVRWSSAFARADTQKNVAAHAIAEISCKTDIDDAADLSRLGWAAGRLIVTGQP